MSILFDEKKQLFTLEMAHASYQMCVNAYGFLQHLHFGEKLGGGSCEGLQGTGFMSFSPAPDIAGNDYLASPDLTQQEYPVFGSGDYRSHCMAVTFADGTKIASIVYAEQISSSSSVITGLNSKDGWLSQTVEDTLVYAKESMLPQA